MLAAICEALAKGPHSRSELHEAVPELKNLPWAGWGQDVMGLAFQQKLCVVGRGASQKFAQLEPVNCAATLGGLLRRYLQGFALGTVKDFTYWAGLKAPEARQAFEELEPEIHAFAIEGKTATYYCLNEASAPLQAALGVKLLAKFDPLIMAYRDKSLLIPEESVKRVFRKAGQVEAVVLSDGVAIGTWRLSRAGSHANISVEPFRPLKVNERKRLEREAARMAKKLGFLDSSVTGVTANAI